MSALLTFTDATEIAVRYRNWRGETTIRAIRPLGIRFGSTEWHPEPQWLMRALDIDKGAEREFAMRDMEPVDA